MWISNPKTFQKLIQFCFPLAMRFPHSLSGINSFRRQSCSFNGSWHTQSLKIKPLFKVSLFKHLKILDSVIWCFQASWVCCHLFTLLVSFNWIHLNLLYVNFLSKISTWNVFNLVLECMNDFYTSHKRLLLLLLLFFFFCLNIGLRYLYIIYYTFKILSQNIFFW